MEIYWYTLLVSTYVVCERLSVMHKLAGEDEILVQILQNTLFYSGLVQNTPPPNNENGQRWWDFRFEFAEYPPAPPPPPAPLQKSDVGTSDLKSPKIPSTPRNEKMSGLQI